MGELKVDNGHIVFISSCCNKILSYDEIVEYEKKNTFLSDLGLRISTIPLNETYMLKRESCRIFVCARIDTPDGVVDIENCEGAIPDYFIIRGAIRKLSSFRELLIQILSECDIKDVSNLSFYEYMQLCKKSDEYHLPLKPALETDTTSAVFLHSSETDDDLCATLFDYQKTGVNWLSFMVDNGCGCILGDEMGLGKTLQIIALMGLIKKNNPNALFLVIVPVSLLDNWKREISKFYPSLKVLKHHGAYRTGLYKDLLMFDVVITSYSNVQSDLSMINMIKWSLVVCDEAQNIKNSSSQRTRNVKKINRDIGIAITGTPFENHLSDIWSISDFVVPGYFGTESQFDAMFGDDLGGAFAVERYLSPFMLRRLVKDVADDLPQRVDIEEALCMTDEEAAAYEQERNALYKNGGNRLGAITKLRMYCTHPSVYDPFYYSADLEKGSAKYSRLVDIVWNIVENGEKGLIFTSFNSIIDAMKTDLVNRFGIYVEVINGSTPVQSRQTIIDRFSEENGASILILNPHAAGTGLNITAANHVIHYNLDWNPAIEDQASARAYRRGQKETVFIHRLFYANTVEEIMNKRIQNKRAMSECAIVGSDGSVTEEDELMEALNLSPMNTKG